MLKKKPVSTSTDIASKDALTEKSDAQISPSTVAQHARVKQRVLLVGLVILALFLVLYIWQQVHTRLPQQFFIQGQLTPLEKSILMTELNQIPQNRFFSTDLLDVRDRALSISWIDRVKIQRKWGTGIEIAVYPQVPVARWGSGYFLNAQGEIFKTATPIERPDLPILHAPTDQAKLLMTRYQLVNRWFSPLGLHLKEIYLTNRKTCVLVYDNELRIIVDQDRTEEKLYDLSVLAREELKDAWSKMTSVDLRYHNGMAVRFKEGESFHGFMQHRLHANSTHSMQ